MKLSEPYREMGSKQIQTDSQTHTKDTQEVELSSKLYFALRELRKRLAKSEGDGVMAYHIFENASLMEISRAIPRSKKDLLLCSGVGKEKVCKYGDGVLETIESTLCEYFNVEKHNASNKDEDKVIQSSVRSEKRATRLPNLSADTIFSAQLLTKLAKSCKKNCDMAKAGSIESNHEADQGETVVAASIQGRKRKNTELENSSEERAEELSSAPILVPSRAETSSPYICARFLVSFPPASEAPNIISRMCRPEATTALRHLSYKKMRIEATRSFALTNYHVGNLIASHEALEDANTRGQALIDKLSLENKELSKLKGEVEKLKSALQEKEEMELKLKLQLIEADKTHTKNMAEARDAWKTEFLQSPSFKRRIIHFNAPIYQSGLMIGMRQAVNKFNHLHASIEEFEPDPEDLSEYKVDTHSPYASP